MSDIKYSVYTHPESGAIWYQPDNEEVVSDGLVMHDSSGLTKEQAVSRCDAIEKEWRIANEEALRKEAEERQRREAPFRFMQQQIDEQQEEE